MDKEFYEGIGNKIRQVRKLRNINQDELAAALNLTRTSVVNIEKGRQRPPIHKLWEICQFLKVSPAEMFPDSPHSIDIMVKVEIAKITEERDEWKNKYTDLKSLLSKLKDHIQFHLF